MGMQRVNVKLAMMIEHDSSALPGFVEYYYGELVGYFTKKLGSSSLASEVIHETYLRVERIGQKLIIANPRAYLYRIANNLATDLYRKEQIRAKHVIAEPPEECIPYEAPSAYRVVEGRERLALLLQAIDTLPPRCREVLIMRKFEQMEYQAIAQQLGISRNMVEKHLRKALQYCRQYLEQES
ncbi:MAG: DNA-directed RNA polymerase sigma-70 factor [Nitrospirales bacterium]|nr:MAG: DNA-directed RNA polymerase sigma-70 factor [Nitrospirales bacterium]